MIGYKSDVGIKRKFNEDSFGYFENEFYRLYIVADGMGGHNAGEVASDMAVKNVIKFVKENIYKFQEDILEKAIKEETVNEYSMSDKKLKGMGTTITSCLCYNGMVIVANVGDSSCFGVKDDKICKLTKDHSLVQQLLDAGSISEDEAMNHPNKNIITRAVGTSKDVEVDIFKFKAKEYDRYLLCSDGLTNEVTIDEMNNILKREKNNKLACDNITVMLFGGERR